MQTRSVINARKCIYATRKKEWSFPLNRLSYGTKSLETAVQSTTETLKTRDNGKLKERLEERLAKDLLLNVLSATTTRRDAKSYLSRFQSSAGQIQQPSPIIANTGDLHLSLFKLRAPQELSEEVIAGLAHTLSQLSRLGLGSAVVLDCESDNAQNSPQDAKEVYYEQGQRLVSSLLKEARGKAFYLDSILAVSPGVEKTKSTVPLRGRVEVQFGYILHQTLASGAIPIIPAIGHSVDTQQIVALESDDVILALTRELAHLRASGATNQNALSSHHTTAERDNLSNLNPRVVLDRIMILDPQGGIPSLQRLGHSHSFVNLEQEFQGIKEELVTWRPHEAKEGCENEDEDHSLQPLVQQHKLKRAIQNLDLVQRALSILPPSTSALITTPWEAATPPTSVLMSTPDLGVKTRRAKNPLIYNLLTDKALVSSSLPNTRLGYFGVSHTNQAESSSSTFIKRGMPLTVIPDPRVEPWKAPRAGEPSLTFDDPRIDFPRLLNLIEDSFNRPLDVEHYLNRIKDRVAGIIVAGEYEGGAILTWELPHGVPDDGSDESRSRMVPYLDKFAVLKRSQGAGGVADMVFTAMVLSCFPDGVCWRSRKNNPVNKWYFERSLGTLRLHDSQWTMFWTTSNLLLNKQKFLDYEDVCRHIQPSWADNKHVVD